MILSSHSRISFLNGAKQMVFAWAFIGLMFSLMFALMFGQSALAAQNTTTKAGLESGASKIATDAFFVDEAKREAQRAAFLRAERAIWSMDAQELQETLKELGDYPLAPYLVAKKLRYKISLDDADDMRAFFAQYGDAPFAKNVRADWLRYLAKRNRRSLFIEFYEHSNSAELQCQFLRYQYEAGVAKADIYKQLPKLWTVGRSQDKACDPVFGVWMKDGGLTEDLILQRIEKAADGGKHSLIPYLRSLLPSDKQYIADRWREVRKDPSQVRHLVRYPGKLPAIEAQIISYGLARLIWRDEDLALSTYKRALQRITFSEEQRARVVHRFAVALALNDHADAERWLVEASLLRPESETMRWHLAYLLKKQDWQSIALLIEKSPPQLTNENQFQYWLARAYEKLGRDEAANALYTQLAQERHYYGFLASARMNIEHSLQNEPVQATEQDVREIVSLEATQRAYELRKLERFYHARLEWVYAQRQLSESQKLAAAVVSSAWEWHDQSIFTLSREGYLNDVDRRFPTAFEDLLTKEALKNDIAPEWAFAIARRESSFMTDAISSADARGLMQILPSTARYLERRVSAKDLFDVDVNTRIGNKYLRYLMNKLDDNALLATASYNAGWRKVLDWLPETGSVEADIWVETIPYRETRNYVKAVLAYQQIYQDKINRQSVDNTVFARFAQQDLRKN
ncbi:transglycosylase SLT domain-containing protein [Glaciecola siphonariae]|uniref:Transglycosylase SLT domain-containing protein n=1 Tax=Glaciecola siphonariae TaxID=521012 RepID=A0ABV9LY53_9ALTE